MPPPAAVRTIARVEVLSPELVLVAPPELRRLALEQLGPPPFSAQQPRAAAESGYTLGAVLFSLVCLANSAAPLLLAFVRHH
jgi:hypothetical protein